MRDLVESVIGQVMQRQPNMQPLQATQSSPVSLKGTHVVQATKIKDKDMWQACCQFESMFLQQMMVAMRKTVPESEFLPRGYADSMYESMMDQAIAESGSQQAPLGIAMSIYRQMEQQGANASDIQGMQLAADNMKTVMPATPLNIGG